MIRVTCVMGNQASRKDLYGEHGLSFFVEADGKKYLFDTGQGEHTRVNAEKLNIPLPSLDGVILSHGHYDHAGGFRYLGVHCPLYIGKGFFTKKYKRTGLKLTDLSPGWDRTFCEKENIPVHEVSSPVHLSENILLLPHIPHVTFEQVPAKYVREEDGKITADDFRDETAVLLRDKERMILLAGCSHPGIVNMCMYAEKAVHQKVYAVLGGIHLKDADEEYMQKTAEGLKKCGVKILGLDHCTGKQAETDLRDIPEFACFHFGAGDIFRI